MEWKNIEEEKPMHKTPPWPRVVLFLTILLILVLGVTMGTIAGLKGRIEILEDRTVEFKTIDDRVTQITELKKNEQEMAMVESEAQKRKELETKLAADYILKEKDLQPINKAKLIADAEVKKRKELEAKLDSERKKNETLVKQLSETTIKMESKDKIILSLRARLEEKPKTKEYIFVQAKSKKVVSGEKKKNADVDITDSETINQEIVFKVQVLSSGTPLSSNSPQFKGQKNVWEYKDGGLYKYTIGNKGDLQSASALQSGLREKGFSGAFVVALQNGKRIPVRKALKLLK